MNSNRTIQTTEELAEAADGLFAWGMPARLVKEYALEGLGGLVADVNWVPTLSFIAGAIEDLDLNCDELVALGREVFAEAYPFPDDAEVPFPFHALAATHRRLWEVCVGGGGIAPEIGEPEMRNARLEMFLLAVGISAHVMQHQSAVLGRFQSPGEYIRNIANTYIVDISITS